MNDEIGYPKPTRAEEKSRRRSKEGLKRSRVRKRVLRKDPYRHPAWLKLRKEKIDEAKGCCQGPHCRGASTRLHVHHLKYNEGKRGWRRLIVPLKWLLVLCVDCHNREHPMNFRGQMLKVKLSDDFMEGL